MLEPLLYCLRANNVKVGLNEWLAFQRALKAGLANSTDELFWLGRALLVHSESDFDSYEKSFLMAFRDLQISPSLIEDLARLLDNPLEYKEGRAPGAHDFENLQELLRKFRETLEKQNKRHQGGNRWVGTGGTSPWGSGGRSNMGLALGQGKGMGTGIRIPDSIDWGVYRQDQELRTRDIQIALKALRTLERSGPEVLDIDESISRTADAGGEIDLCFRQDRDNKVRVVLLLDIGGSMTPYAQLVSRFFTAAGETSAFKSLDVWHFHNCVYGTLYSDEDLWRQTETNTVLASLTKAHRVIFVGDASMAPWELHSRWSKNALNGLGWLSKFKSKCPKAIWLNPEPERYWEHPTISAIHDIFPMFPLNILGLKSAIRELSGGY
jgi:uncharacterized protein